MNGTIDYKCKKGRTHFFVSIPVRPHSELEKMMAADSESFESQDEDSS
jgi:hypothetical protein